MMMMMMMKTALKVFEGSNIYCNTLQFWANYFVYICIAAIFMIPDLPSV